MEDKIITRLFTYLQYKAVPHTRFEKEIGLSNGYLKTQLKRNSDLGEGIIRKIIDNCLDMDAIWLITGRGSMLVDSQPKQIAIQSSESSIYYNMYKEEKAENKELIEQVGALKQTIRQLEEKIAGLQQNIRPDTEFGTDKASVGSTRTRKTGAVGLGGAQFADQ